ERTLEEYFAEFENPQISSKGKATMLLSSLTRDNLPSYMTVNGEIAGNNILIKPAAVKPFRDYLEALNDFVPIQETKTYEIDGLTVHFKTAQFWYNAEMEFIFRRVSGSGREPDILEDLAHTTFGLISDKQLNYDLLSYSLNAKDEITKIDVRPNYTTFYSSAYYLERIETELAEMVHFFAENDKLCLFTE
ncbi:MAG TPA: hypothetical protein PKE69_27840, partial [Pyrinomonadaceae bacterium]|nr:hypothetical protein [Pyrinomonadaceae bacterium]